MRPRALLAFALLLLLTAGCTPNTPPGPTTAPPPVQRWDGLVGELRELWSAEPGIDLENGPAAVVRAYRESIDLAQATGKMDDVYPGFATAVLPNVPSSRKASELDRWPSLVTPETKPSFGNLKSHLLSVNQAGRDVTAVVCYYQYAAATEETPGKLVSWGRGFSNPNLGIFVYRVDLLAPEHDSSGALPPQKGPEPAPVDDVFGGWKVTGSLNDFAYDFVDLAREWPSYQTDLATCVAKAPDPPDRRHFLTAGEHPRSDFPTQPANPGWPAESR